MSDTAEHREKLMADLKLVVSDAEALLQATAGQAGEGVAELRARVQASGRMFTRQVDKLPPADVLAEINKKVNIQHLEETLMHEGLAKFADPQKALLKLIAQKREKLAAKK